ncbi:MAG: sterol desaturase family protein [Alphaproteobacteria bacterium]|nr:sterol desaturase family protein [Alphaproteobacteria bacterium]
MQGFVQILLAAKSVLSLGWLALFLVLERLRPSAAPPPGPAWPRLARNGALWLLNAGLSFWVTVPLTAWATTHALWQRPDWWGGALGLALDVALLEFWIYWWHRWNHELRFLWRFHEIHHLDQFLDASSAVRFHFGEVALSAAARALVVMALAVRLEAVLVFETVLLLVTVFHHSNVKLAPRFERALARVLITPSIHWVHHHARRSDTDANYGTVWSFWDRLFGTASPTPRTRDLAIGVEGVREQPLPALLLRPFRPRA